MSLLWLVLLVLIVQFFLISLLQEILGQFNLGFIITRLNDDLFIVDQHASDEKYNFETLQRTTEMQSQQLSWPEPLILNPTTESILLENVRLFELNGFKFQIDERNDTDPEPASTITRRIKLVAKPYSKNWSFGKDDIDEILFMIQESEGEVKGVLRPSKVRAMLASRACRASVMIGRSLTNTDMKRLVSQMGTIEQPWVRTLIEWQQYVNY